MQLAVAHDRLGQTDKALEASRPSWSAATPSPRPQLPARAHRAGPPRLRERTTSNSARKRAGALPRRGQPRTPSRSRKAPPPSARASCTTSAGSTPPKSKHEDAAQRFGEVVKLAPEPPAGAGRRPAAGHRLGQQRRTSRPRPSTSPRCSRPTRSTRNSRAWCITAGLALARQKQWDQARYHFKRIVETVRRLRIRRPGALRMGVVRTPHRNAPRRRSNSTRSSSTIPPGEPARRQGAERTRRTQPRKRRAGQGHRPPHRDPRQGEGRGAARGHPLPARQRPFQEGRPRNRRQSSSRNCSPTTRNRSCCASILFQAGESQAQDSGKPSPRATTSPAAAAASGSDRRASPSRSPCASPKPRRPTGQHAEAKADLRRLPREVPREPLDAQRAASGSAFAMENAGDSRRRHPRVPASCSPTRRSTCGRCAAASRPASAYFNLQEYDQAVAEFVNVEINYAKYPDWQAKAVLEIARVLIAQDKKDAGRRAPQGVAPPLPAGEGRDRRPTVPRRTPRGVVSAIHTQTDVLPFHIPPPPRLAATAVLRRLPAAVVADHRGRGPPRPGTTPASSRKPCSP